MENTAVQFNNYMMRGNVKAAVRLLSSTDNTGILPLSPETMHELRAKHPDAKLGYDEMLLSGPVKYINPVVYEQIDEAVIYKVVVHTKGAAGISMLDADE